MTTEYVGRGDPARAMALLWRSREPVPRGRGRPPGIDVDLILAAAIDEADNLGLGALSMRRVAQRLGVGAMTLYSHVPGKAELLDAMIDTVYAEVLDGGDSDSAGGWRAALERVARANWTLYRRHPWILQVAASRPVLGPNLMAKYDQELRAVADTGLDEFDMDAVVTLITGFVQGAAKGAVDSAGAEQRTGQTDEQWWSAHAPYLENVFDADRWPTAARVGAVAGAAFDPQAAFEFGLSRVLDGIDVFIGSQQAAAG